MREITLSELSVQEAEELMKSLLKAERIPGELRSFIKEKAEGNPFYLEEFINTLIQSEILTRNNGDWELNRTISEEDIPPTINGILTARLDQLGKSSKRILQEASVIGRAFLYEILAEITNIPLPINEYINELEQRDLIRVRSLQPELEYVFKHVLTQEVVYQGMLKKERRAIHERIGTVMENLFNNRLPEFYEILAYHFRRGESVRKAVHYLVRSGEKSIGKYAVEESHQYFRQAFELLSKTKGESREHKKLIIDLLLKWALVFYYRGDALGLENLLLEHENMAMSLGDEERLGMLQAWLGYVLFWREKYRASYDYLNSARKIGKETANMKVEGYACTWLPFTCAELGLFEEGIMHGERAREISEHYPSDKYLLIKPVSGIGYIHFFTGNRKGLIECAELGIDYGRESSDIRSLGMGYSGLGLSHLLAGDFEQAVAYCTKAVNLSADPLYKMAFRTMLSFCCLYGGRFEQAEDNARKVLGFTMHYGVDWLGTMARLVLSVTAIAKGEMGQGLQTLKEVQEACIANESRWLYTMSEHIMGRVYLRVVEESGPRSLSFLARNIGFLVKNVPLAGRKAEKHFNNAISLATELGADGVLGQVYLDLGLLHKAKKNTEQARGCISKAIRIFERCNAEGFILKAKKELAVLR
jgi:tetratricopeptide (TPR) repeat protein